MVGSDAEATQCLAALGNGLLHVGPQPPVGQRLGLDAIEPHRSLMDDLLLERQGLLANDEPVARRRVACPLGEPGEEVERHLPARWALRGHEALSLAVAPAPP